MKILTVSLVFEEPRILEKNGKKIFDEKKLILPNLKGTGLQETVMLET